MTLNHLEQRNAAVLGVKYITVVEVKPVMSRRTSLHQGMIYGDILRDLLRKTVLKKGIDTRKQKLDLCNNMRTSQR